jgi:hypothetical protein
VEAADLDRIADGLIESRGLPEDSDRARAIRSGHDGMWQQVEPYTSDGQISCDGFIEYHDELLATPGAYDATIGQLSDLIFSTLDADDDDRITLDEHRTFFRIYGIDPALADTVFPMWDTDGNGFVSTTELAAVVHEFFHSSDADSPGNWLFGPIFSDMEKAHPIDA